MKIRLVEVACWMDLRRAALGANFPISMPLKRNAMELLWIREWNEHKVLWKLMRRRLKVFWGRLFLVVACVRQATATRPPPLPETQIFIHGMRVRRPPGTILHRRELMRQLFEFRALMRMKSGLSPRPQESLIVRKASGFPCVECPKTPTTTDCTAVVNMKVRCKRSKKSEKRREVRLRIKDQGGGLSQKQCGEAHTDKPLVQSLCRGRRLNYKLRLWKVLGIQGPGAVRFRSSHSRRLLYDWRSQSVISLGVFVFAFCDHVQRFTRRSWSRQDRALCCRPAPGTVLAKKAQQMLFRSLCVST